MRVLISDSARNSKIFTFSLFFNFSQCYMQKPICRELSLIPSNSTRKNTLCRYIKNWFRESFSDLRGVASHSVCAWMHFVRSMHVALSNWWLMLPDGPLFVKSSQFRQRGKQGTAHVCCGCRSICRPVFLSVSNENVYIDGRGVFRENGERQKWRNATENRE